MAKRSLDIIIAGHNKTQRAFSAVGAGLDSFKRHVLSLKNLLIGGIGIYAIQREARVAIEAFGIEEQSSNQLQAALAKLKAESQMPQMEVFANQMQKLTVYGNETIKSVMTLGASLGRLEGEQLQKATKAAIGLAKRIGTDLEPAMRLIARAAVGDTAQLATYGIKLDETLSPQQKFARLLEMGAESFSMATAEAQTGTGRLAQFKNMVGDLREEIGRGLMPIVLQFTSYIQSNEKQIRSWIAGFGRGVVQTVAFVAANRDLVIGIAKTAAAVAGLIVLGPPLIAMLKGVSTACLFLAKNPLVLLAATVAAVAAAFMDWEEVIDRIKSKLDIKMPEETYTDTNRSKTEELIAQNSEMTKAAQRLAELRQTEKLNNQEKAEAVELTRQLNAAYPLLADQIKALGTNGEATAAALAAIGSEQQQRVLLLYNKQLLDAEMSLKYFTAAAKEAEEKLAAAPRPKAPEHPNDLEKWFSTHMPWGDEKRYQKQREELANQAAHLAALRRHRADAEKEVDRLRAIMDSLNPPAAKHTFLDAIRERLEQLPRLIKSAGDALKKLIPESMRSDYQEKNADLLHNLKMVRARGIEDDLQRETELIRLEYEKRIEAARKANQDITLLEKARDEEIAQARRRAEQREGEERKARAKSLASEIARLRITTTKEGLERELALLKQAEQEDLQEARDEAEKALIRQKYDLLRKQARQNAQESQERTPGPVSIGAVDRGFLTRAPGQYDPYREAQKKQQEIAKNTGAAAEAGKAALGLLGTIAEKLGILPQVQVQIAEF